jgi:DNA-binding MurR/RpiR family transcriptional regulator
MTVAETILQSLDSLTAAERRVGRIILSSYPSFGLQSTTAIGKAAQASSATVVRFVTKLGFEGVPDFHHALREEIGHRMSSPFWELGQDADRSSSEFLGVMTETQSSLVRETLGRLSEDVLSDLRHVLMRSSRLWIAGGRFSQSLAHYLYAHLQLFRPQVRLLVPWPAPITDQIFHVTRGDCLVVFDYRRYDVEAEFAARYFKTHRSKVVVVTDPYLSPAAHHADHTLIASFEGRMLLGSHTGATALVDAIVTYLMSRDEALRERIDSVEDARDLLSGRIAEDAAHDGRLRARRPARAQH